MYFLDSFPFLEKKGFLVQLNGYKFKECQFSLTLIAHSAGGKTESDQPSASGTSEESGCSSRKRARKGSFGGSLIDLNLPAEVIDRN